MARGQDQGTIEITRREVTPEGDVIIDLDFDSKINLFPERDDIERRLKEASRYPGVAPLAKNWQKVLPKEELHGIEGFNALYTLLALEIEGGLKPEEVETMRSELIPQGDFSDAKVVALHRLQNILPLLDIPSPSTESFKKMLEANSGGDILNAARDEDDVEAIHHAARIIEMLSVSREDPRVPFIEEVVGDNFTFAQERSQIFNRRVKHLPVVVSPDSLWMMGFRPEVTIIPKILKMKTLLNGFAYSSLPGNGGIEPTVIVAHTSEDEKGTYVDPDILKKTMVHEMIHDTQESNTLDLEKDPPKGWSQAESVQFLEALTEGLAVLRVKENKQSEALIAHGPYQFYVSSLFSLLGQVEGIKPADFEDRLTYLNNIPLNEAIDLLGEWTGEEDVRQAFQENFRPDIPKIKKSKAIFRPIKTFRQIRDILAEHEQKSIALIDHVFAATPIFKARVQKKANRAIG